MKGRNPRTPTEWQEAADAASFMVHLESAKQYGLVTGGPVVDAKRCLEILDEARRTYGIKPRPFTELLREYTHGG